MSRRSDRKARQREKRAEALRNTAIALVFGLVMLGLGAFGLLSNLSQLRDYENSPDVRTVEAEVTAVDAHRDKTKDVTGGMPEYYYHANLEFSVDGSPTYTGEADFSQQLNDGDTVRVEVYQRPDGSYAVSRITDKEKALLASIPTLIALGAGAIVTLAAVVVGIGGLRKKV